MPVCEAVSVLLSVALELGVPVCDAVPVRLPVALELGMPVCVTVPVLLPVSDVTGPRIYTRAVERIGGVT